jgi:hypothetical protein
MRDVGWQCPTIIVISDFHNRRPCGVARRQQCLHCVAAGALHSIRFCSS